MTLKTGKGGANKPGSGKVIAQSHNVAKGGFQKAKLGALQSKQAFMGKKDIKPIGKAGPPVGKPQKPVHGGSQAKFGKGVQGKKGKIDDDDDEEDDEDDEDDDLEEDMDDDEDEDGDDDEDEDDEDDDDEELSGDSDEDIKPKIGDKQAKTIVTPKSILKNGSTPKSGVDDKAPKLLLPKANEGTPKGESLSQAKANQNKKPEQKAAADKKAVKVPEVKKAVPAGEKAKTNERQRTTSGSEEAFKLIANTEAEALTPAVRSEFETRVKRIANCTVFVKGLHRRCTEDDLRRLLKDVLAIRLPSHESKGSKAGSGRIRGYAFLEFKDEATARRNTDFLNKEARMLNSEGQPCKLEASISSAGGYVMTADDWNVGSLYVSNLPEQVTENDVLSLFERAEVVTVVLPRNRVTGNPRGAAHVRIRSAESSIRQFDAIRAKILRGEFSLKGRTLSIAFSSQKTLKREREGQSQKTEKKAIEVKAQTVTPSQTPKPAAVQIAAASASAGKVTPTTASNKKGNAAANKSLNESVTKKTAANVSLTKKPETPVSAQKGGIKRKLGDEDVKPIKVAKRDEDDDE